MSDAVARDNPFDPRSPDGERLRSEIEAEFADHLAAATGDLVRRGEDESAAQRAALARFGSVRRVARQCWWVHKGDQIMFRTTIVALVAVGVIALGAASWQFQRGLSARTEELSAQLAALAKSQQTLVDQQRPPEITGRAYYGDPTKPAQDVEIKVYKFGENPVMLSDGTRGSVKRRVRTDADGRFTTGPLLEGDYSLIAPLWAAEGSDDPERLLFHELQSRPMFLMNGVAVAPVEFDVQAGARVELACDPKLPDVIPWGDVEIPVVVMFSVHQASYDGRFPVLPNDEVHADEWPAPGLGGVGTFFASTLPRSWEAPGATYDVTMTVQIGQPVPHGTIKPPSMLGASWLGGGMAGGMGGFGGGGMGGGMFPTTVTTTPQSLKLARGDNVTLRLTVPGESLASRFESQVRALEATSELKSSDPKFFQEVIKAVVSDLKLELQVERQPPQGFSVFQDGK